MEITFTRSAHYSLSVEGADLAELATRLHMSIRKLKILIEDGNIDREQKQDIAAWIDEKIRPNLEVTSEEDIEDLEVHTE